MIGVALGALTRNTIGAIVAAIAWTLFVEQVILAAIVPGIEKWLPDRGRHRPDERAGPQRPPAAGRRPGAHRLRRRLLLAASQTTMRRDVT